jgi:cyanophycinase
MSSPLLRAAAGALSLTLLGACSSSADLVAPRARLAKAPAPDYESYVTGTPNATSTPLGGVYLAGGGTDDDGGMGWLVRQGGVAGGTKKGAPYYGDVVVLRTSGSKGYNNWIDKLGANSVTTLVINTIDGANSDSVEAAINRAEVIFLAGGDQSTYVNLWSGTRLQRAVNARVAAGYPIGGTSAGLAALPQFIYSAQFASTTSAMALADPYDSTITFAQNLFTVPLLTGLITDSHFVTRDRMGRCYTFLARLQADGVTRTPRGLGVDEGSGVGIAADGSATVYGAGNGAYLVTPSPRSRSTLSAPLTYGAMTVVRVPVGGSFNATTFTAGGVGYTVVANGGVLTSSAGTIY